MKGTNVDLGKQILADSGLRYEVGETLEEAAAKVVACLNKTAVAV
jgi:succinyl-CoA synthetase beta subunit